MHSSRMRTARSLPCRGGYCPGSLVSLRETPLQDRDTSPVDRMTNLSKTITLPQILFAGSKNLIASQKWTLFGNQSRWKTHSEKELSHLRKDHGVR